MATIKYFTTCEGETVQLSNIRHSGSISIKAAEFSGMCQCGQVHQADRKIEYKSFPSRHDCGPRCFNATGHLCECSCGGKNHGHN